jgi:hypothetical protein
MSQQDAADESVNLAQRAADMASVFNTDVVTALEAIQAGLRGEADPLERFGVGLSEAAVNAKAVELGLAATTSEVDASAKAQARLALIFEQTDKFAGDFANTSDSVANRQRILSAEFENLKAAIGQGVLPVMESLLGVARSGVGAFTALDGATGGMLGQFATMATVASLGVGGLSLLAGQAIKMRGALGDAKDAAAGLVSGIRNLGVAGTALTALPGILLAAGAGLELWNQQQQRMNVDRLTDEFLAAGESAAAMRDVLASMVDKGPTELIDSFAELASTNREAAERFVDTAEAAGASGEVIAAMREHLDTTAAAEAQMATDTEAASGALGAQAGATEDATSALQEYSDQLQAMTDPVFAAMDAITGVRDAQVGLADAERGVLEAQVALDEAIATHGATSAEAAEATLGLEDAQRGLADAQWGAVTSAAEADSALAGLKDAVDNGKVSVDTFKDTLAQWVAQGFLTQAQADRAAASVSGLAAEADVADSKRVDIPVAAPGSPSTWQALRDVKEEALSIPGSRNTHVSASGVSTVIGQFDSLARAINRASGGNIRVSVGGGGGLVLHDGGYVPGPRGQEVAAILQAGERVLSLDEVDSMSRGIPAAPFAGGGGRSWVDNRTVIYQISNQDPQGTIEAIKRYERDNGPGWRAA